jgi:hypothetical protein
MRTTMSSTCRAAGCAGRTTRYGSYCNTHKARLRRHGAPDQAAITKAALAPYVGRVRRRRAKNESHLLWGNLDKRWAALIEHAKAVQAPFLDGRAGYIPNFEAACDIVKLGEHVAPEAVVETVLAMYLMLDAEPRRFRSDEAFRAQLVRRVRGLSEVSAGTWFDYRSGGVRRTYRELRPRTSEVFGEWLTAFLGGPGVYLAKLERQAAERAEEEQRILEKQLKELA